MCDLKPLLTSFGNPLLDMTLVVKDTKLHKTFGLPVDGQLEVNREQRKLFDIVMERDDIEYSAGGCALNSSRVFSWVLGESNQAVFVGGIGVDEQAGKLTRIIHESGVATKLVKVEDEPTGSCVALVLGAQRCLAADIGAAAVCEPEHVFKPDILELMDSSLIIYVEGYFITHSFKTALKIAKYCLENNKILVFNLCGSYVCENHPNELTEILPYVDVLFGYIEEYRTLKSHVNIPKLCNSKALPSRSIVHDINRVFSFVFEDDPVISNHQLTNGTTCCELSTSPIYLNGDAPSAKGTPLLMDGSDDKPLLSDLKEHKLVIVTQGPGPIFCASRGQVFEKDVAPIRSEEIVDTTGAGDSFVGGFLAALVCGKSVDESMDCGTWTAQQLLRQRGCSLPPGPATFL